MKEQLTLQELSAYLPWEVEVVDIDNVHCKISALYTDCVGVEYEMNVGEYEMQFDEIKLCLLPLSSLTKEIEHKGERFVPKKELGLVHDVSGNKILNYRTGDEIDILSLPYFMIQKLHEWHFAVNIHESLYVDKSTL